MARSLFSRKLLPVVVTAVVEEYRGNRGESRNDITATDILTTCPQVYIKYSKVTLGAWPNYELLRLFEFRFTMPFLNDNYCGLSWCRLRPMFQGPFFETMFWRPLDTSHSLGPHLRHAVPNMHVFKTYIWVDPNIVVSKGKVLKGFGYSFCNTKHNVHRLTLNGLKIKIVESFP